MSQRVTGADLLAALAEGHNFNKSAAETLASLDEDDIASLDEDTLAYLIEAADEELAKAGYEYNDEEYEKTASEIVGEMDDEELAAALSEMDEDEVAALFEQIQSEEQEQEKVAALMGGEYDEYALAGQVFGTAAGEALSGILKEAADDGDDEWEYVDLDNISADELVAGIESGEIIEYDDGQEKVAYYDDDELTLDDISAADFLALLDEEEQEKTAGQRINLLRARIGDAARGGFDSYKRALTGEARRDAWHRQKNLRKLHAAATRPMTEKSHNAYKSLSRKNYRGMAVGTAKQSFAMGSTAAPVVIPSAMFLRRKNTSQSGQ